MPSIRDIINAATPGQWKWGVSDGVVVMRGAEDKFILSAWAKWEGNLVDVDCEPSDADFIRTFDPEHVALMEAEHRAVEKYFVAFDYLRVVGSLGDVSPTILNMAHREMYEAREALKAAHESIPTYRKERGWE